MGPESAKSHPGRQLVHSTQRRPDQPAERARQEIAYGRRGGGSIFGAFQPATGEAFTRPDPGRTIVNGVDFLEHVEDWLPEEADRVYAIVDNLTVPRAVDVLLFCLAHPRWEFVFQPKYAAYLNLSELWWKGLRSLALKGRRFESWEDIGQAIAQATAYWNKHRHPFIWGRRRHRARRPSIAALPKAA